MLTLLACLLVQMSAQKFLTFTTNIDWTSQHTKEMKVLFNDPAIQQVVDQCTPTQQYKFRLYVVVAPSSVILSLNAPMLTLSHSLSLSLT